MEPKIIRKEQMIIAGIMGDGNMTATLWEDFECQSNKIGLSQKTDSPGYEIRMDYDGTCDCFVGQSVLNKKDAEGFETLILPSFEYAVFDVLVANGYDSENENMNTWLEENKALYSQAKIDNKNFVVECYNERFNQGIVEIWIPLERKSQ